MRFAAVQSGGVGGDREVWGAFWAEGLTRLGADVGLVAETRVWGDGPLAAAVRGFWNVGYVAIANGVKPAADSPLANGVVLAVRKDLLGTWESVDKDEAGRGVAGTLVATDGVEYRVVGVYGVAGASLPGFESSPNRLRAEAKLAEFVRTQMQKATEFGWVVIIMGDMNSVTDPRVDAWQGTHVARPASLVGLLAELGLVDSFRARHPNVRGFSYFAGTRTASRLDGIWVWRPPGISVTLLNAALLWQWPRRADHEPALLDILALLPLAPVADAPLVPVPWRDHIARMLGAEHDALASQVESAVAARRPHVCKPTSALNTQQPYRCHLRASVIVW